MAVWMTKVWGFGEPVGPLQFSTEGWRDRARSQLRPGDVVVLVGTMSGETQDHERNRLLGMMEPSTEAVMALDYLSADRPEDFNERGEYKWPFGLLNRRAWRLDEPRTRLADIADRNFSMDSAQGIVPLTKAEAARVMALARTEVALLPSLRATARLEGDDAARRRGAPPPSTTRTGVMHLRKAPAFTYAMAIERPIVGARRPELVGVKVGWAFEWKSRMRGFNKVSMPQLGGLAYRGLFKELWGAAMDAYRMEQAVLQDHNGARHRINHEILTGVSEDDLRASWVRCLETVRARRRPYEVRAL